MARNILHEIVTRYVNVRFPYSEYLKVMLFKTKFVRNFCSKLYRFTDVQTFYEHYGYLYQMHEELPLMRLDYPLFELSVHVRVADRSSQAQLIHKGTTNRKLHVANVAKYDRKTITRIEQFISSDSFRVVCRKPR